MCKVRRMDINCWQSCSGSEPNIDIFFNFWPSDSLVVLVFWPLALLLNSKGNPVSGAQNTRGGKIDDFRLKSLSALWVRDVDAASLGLQQLTSIRLILHMLAISIINSYYYYFYYYYYSTRPTSVYTCIYLSPFLSHSFKSNWTVTVYSFVVYTYLIVLIDCIGFDHTLLLFYIQLFCYFFLQLCQ